jgi:hypothetical protein
MTKEDAIQHFVDRCLQQIPTQWVQTVADQQGELHRFPMWGMMFLAENWIGERLWERSKVVNAPGDIEMDGERRIGDTPAFIYRIDGRYVIGVHGAGWNFYDGVWDKLYDLAGLAWHEWSEAGADE